MGASASDGNLKKQETRQADLVHLSLGLRSHSGISFFCDLDAEECARP